MYDIVCLEVYNRIAINVLIFKPIYYTKIQKNVQYRPFNEHFERLE